MSSSDGWPLNGPSVASGAGRRPRPRRRTSAAAARCRPPPTCTCTGAATRRSGRRCRGSWRPRSPGRANQELDVAEPEHGRRAPSVTRSCGRRSMSRSEMPPSRPTTGRSTWSVRRPGEDLGRGEATGGQVDAAPRLGKADRRPAGPAAQRQAADDERQRRDAGAGASRSSAARADRAGESPAKVDAAPASPASRPSRARARSSRTGPGRSPSSSPKPSGETAATGRPFTYVPFVLPRSSTYQLRPRKVRTAWSVEANGSSMTIALLTSRPSVVIASRSNERPDLAHRPATRRRRGRRATRPALARPPAGRAAATRTTRARNRYRSARNSSRTIQMTSRKPSIR